MSMASKQIAAAWALVKAATEVPWHVAGVRVKLDRQDTHAICKYDEDAKRDLNIANVWHDPKTGLGHADARFIIASRELVPQLLTEIERLNAQAREDALQYLATAGQVQDALTALEAERAKVVKLARVLDAARAVNHDSLHGNGLEGFRKNRDRLRIALDQLEIDHE